MTDEQRPGAGDRPPPEIQIDIDSAHPARVHNYLAGGEANFAADREAADQAAAVLPGGLEMAQRAVGSMAAFLARAVRYLVGEAGITQFLKLGVAVPAGKDVHEIVQPIAPGARVVYVGDDPTVLAHAHSMRRSGPEGVTAYVHANLLDVEWILEQASATLDLTRPVALLSPATLNFVADEDDPHGVMARFVDAVAPGSHLALAHSTNEGRSEQLLRASEKFAKLLGEPYVVRTRDEIARFFDRLELVDPGLVPIDEWRPPLGADEVEPLPLYGAVGRKP